MKEKQELKYQLKILPVLHTGAKANISWCVNRLGLLRNIVFLKVMTQSARKSSGEKKAYSIAKKKTTPAIESRLLDQVACRKTFCFTKLH